MREFDAETIEAFGSLVEEFGEVGALIRTELIAGNLEYAEDLHEAWAKENK